MVQSYYIEETASTNTLMWHLLQKEKIPEGFMVYTDFQQAGKGQKGNIWESEKGKNLLFSIFLYPGNIPLDQFFLISQLISVGIKNALDKLSDGITVKWPNDIYWNDKKLAGILIENSFQANKVKMVVGIGLNVNQIKFESGAPNPVSLKQILNYDLNRFELLESIYDEIIKLYSELNADEIRSNYIQMLYRKDGFHSFRAENEIFLAKIACVNTDGRLELITSSGELKKFYFKEVEFI